MALETHLAMLSRRELPMTHRQADSFATFAGNLCFNTHAEGVPSWGICHETNSKDFSMGSGAGIPGHDHTDCQWGPAGTPTSSPRAQGPPHDSQPSRAATRRSQNSVVLKRKRGAVRLPVFFFCWCRLGSAAKYSWCFWATRTARAV